MVNEIWEMTESEAKQIGSSQALVAVFIGLVIAYLIAAPFFGGITWFAKVHFKDNLIVGAAIMLGCGFLYGRRAGYEILIKKRDHTWVGFKYGFLTLLTTAFLSGWTGFFEEGIHGPDSFQSYILAPALWITIFGLVPVVIIGFWFGRQIKKRSPNG
jgi:hypothetical protein